VTGGGKRVGLAPKVVGQDSAETLQQKNNNEVQQVYKKEGSVFQLQKQSFFILSESTLCFDTMRKTKHKHNY
jgi:hypothetical protein